VVDTQSKFRSPKLDEAYVGRKLGIPEDQDSPRLHALKNLSGSGAALF
jgi:hypothetical protein